MALALPLLLLFVSFIEYSTDAFSASDGIKIVGLPGGQVQSLPAMYVQSFRRWIVSDDDDEDGIMRNTRDRGGPTGSCASLKMEPVPGAGISPLPEDGGWVNPTTTEELWWPRDLPTLQVRPMLNVLFRNGMLSYVSAGLDARVPRRPATNERKGNEGDVESWRNFGLNSQPIARIWTTLEVANEKSFHVEAFVLRDREPAALFPRLETRDVMRRVATFVAELDTLSPLAEGFHIASFPMMDSWTDLSKGGEEKGADSTSPMYKIVCLATSEPNASELLSMDEDLLTMSSTSVLEVAVSRSAKGCDSPYLAGKYKDLYLNQT